MPWRKTSTPIIIDTKYMVAKQQFPNNTVYGRNPAPVDR